MITWWRGRGANVGAIVQVDEVVMVGGRKRKKKIQKTLC
jgi:hypothetical protein